MKILSVDSNTGSRFYRLIPQMKWMEQQGHQVRMIAHNDPAFDQAIVWADVIIFQMVFSAETVADCKKLGKKVIFECDDLIHAVPKTHYSYEETDTLWKRIQWWWRIFQVLRRCDGFISTNKVLNRYYGWIARKSLVFNNYSDLSHWLKEPKKNVQDGTVRLLWAGSTSHVGDLNFIRPVIRRLLDKYPQLKFVYIGMGGAASDDLYAQFIYGEDFFSDMPKGRRESVLPVHAQVWPYILASLQGDIAIAPLEQNQFNEAKSQCKYLEYGINGIPGVYSRWFYTDVQDGVTGFLADTHDEWVAKLSRLIEDGILRKKIGAAAREDVINNHDATKFLGTWQKFVEDIGRGK